MQITFKLSSIFLLNNEITISVDKKMRIKNFQKLKRRDHSPKRDEFVDVSSDPPYFSLDSPFKSFLYFRSGACVLSIPGVEFGSFVFLEWSLDLVFFMSET